MRFTIFKLLFTFSFLFCFFLISFSQERYLGTWKSFMPYSTAITVCDAGDKVFCAAPKSVFSYEKGTGVIQIYDKTSGLTDADIKTMNYDPTTKVLVVAYTNSNLDLVFSGTDIYNIPDIKNSSSTGSIGINGISFYNGRAYVSSDLGISEINLVKKEIMNTYIIGTSGAQVKVYASCIDETNIYAATEEGVKFATLTSSNLQDFNSWVLFDSTQNLPKKKAIHATAFNNKVYAVISANNCDTLYEYNGVTWTKKFFAVRNTITSLNAVNNNLYFTVWNDDSTTAGKNGKVDTSGNVTTPSTLGHVRPNSWFEDGNVSWESDAWNGLFKNMQGNIERITPDGPGTSSVRDIEISNGVVYIATGGANESWDPVFSGDGFFVYNNGAWSTYNQYSNPALSTFWGIICVAAVPNSDKTYFGSFLSGLMEFNNSTGNMQFYDTLNSILEPVNGDFQRIRVSCLAVDKNNNLWIGNSGANKQIKMISNDGTWRGFLVPHSFQVMKNILIDSYGQLWAPVRRSGDGLLVWSNNGTIDNPNDDVSRLLTSGKGTGGLPDPLVYCLAEDKDGNIWAGTAQGIGIFYCPGNILTSNGCDADQIKVERDGYIGYLFGTENVRAIAVDAANRKWIGTTNGLWLTSDDGKKELLKFTIDNSPLPANQITDIAIDDETGEVFIGTIGGLVSYQGDAIADCRECDDALVYPNPVKPDYTGPIAIKGLTDNAYVKITDIAGTLIYQGRANGCQMTWDGKGYNGNRAKSGVYLVFSSTDLGKEKRVAKILMSN